MAVYQNGIDVSRYQGNINWGRVAAAGKQFAMVRVGSSNSGGLYVDPYFLQNVNGAKAAGLRVGAYYYTYAQNEAARAVELVKVKQALQGKTFQLPVAVDVEDNKLKPIPAKELSALVAGAAKQIEAWGLYAMVYTYTSYANTELDMDALKAFDLWIADYRGKRPSRKHGIWQYTSEGTVPGITGDVDLNHAYKNYPAIIQRAGLSSIR